MCSRLTSTKYFFLALLMSLIAPVLWSAELDTKHAFPSKIPHEFFYFLIVDLDFRCLKNARYLDKLVARSENLLKIYRENKHKKQQRIKDIYLMQLMAVLQTVKYDVDNCVLVEDLLYHFEDEYTLSELKRAEREFLRTIRCDFSVVPESFLYLLFDKDQLELIPKGKEDDANDPQFIAKREASIPIAEAYLDAMKNLSEKILKIYFKNKRAKKEIIKDYSLVQLIAVLLAEKYLAEKNVWMENLYSQIRDRYGLNTLKKAEVEFLKTIDYKFSFLPPLILENKTTTENKTVSDPIAANNIAATKNISEAQQK